MGGLHPGGLCIQGDLLPGGLHLGGLHPEGSAFRGGLSSRQFASRGWANPPKSDNMGYSQEQAVRILLECIFTTRKQSLGQGNIFRSMCQEFFPGGMPGPRGLGSGRGWWVWSWGVGLVRGCLVPGGRCLVDTLADGYCCGRYASYWNAFL